MNIVCGKSQLLDGINIALRAISGKSTMAILECMVIEAKEGGIKLISNDLEIGIETMIQGEIVEEGSIAVNAKIFFDIIKKLPADTVKINVDANYVLTISGGKAKFDLLTKSTEEFPFLPAVVKRNHIVISQFTLKEVIRQTVFSISDNESAKTMTGELFEIHGNQLRVISLDGHRVSIRKVELKDSFRDLKVIIPGKTLLEISKILNGGVEDEVKVYFTEKHVLFEFGSTIFLSRLIEGEYYKVDKMLSSEYTVQMTVNKREMLEAIDRTTLLIKESDKKPVIIDIRDETMRFSIQSAIGSMDEEIGIQKSGNDIVIGFNPKFLMDALRVIDEEEVNIYMIHPKAPCFIKDKEESYIYLILPVNFKS